MKTKMLLTIFLVVLLPQSVRSQGTFQYDQQSADEGNIQEGGSDIQQSQFIGQSFTPGLSSIGFIRLYIYNGLLGDISTATIHVNLRATSISGPSLGASIPVVIPGGSLFSSPVDFFFPNPVPVSAGTTYYFQPVVENNNNLGLNVATYNYLAGTAFGHGVPSPTQDLWFREGIIVPEPSSALLLLLGGGLAAWHRRRKFGSG
jgi:hypothetical protein